MTDGSAVAVDEGPGSGLSLKNRLNKATMTRINLHLAQHFGITLPG
jgi:hypothetical protein